MSTFSRVGMKSRLISMEKELEHLENNNDGSLTWVDDIRQLISDIDTLEFEMSCLCIGEYPEDF